MSGSTIDRLEHKIKELNAIKAEFRQELEDAEKRHKKGEIDRAHLNRIRERTEEHIERINEKIRDAHKRIQDSRSR
jgi:chromosome segregation ATPase